MDTINSLVSKLEELSKYYYEGNTQVTDAEFDALEAELRKLDPTNIYFNKIRETVTSTFGTKYPHPYQFIGSVDKIHSVDEAKVLHRPEVVISAKLDGTSLVAYFVDGKLDKALTRGDGYFGVGVTDKFIKLIEKYSWFCPPKFTGAIRGEVIFTFQNWETFKQGHPEAKLPRTSGTGLINGKGVAPEVSLLDWIVYDVVATNDSSYHNYWDLLSVFGFPLAPHEQLIHARVPNDTALRTLYDEWNSIYPMDGLVIRDITPPEEAAQKGIYYYLGSKEAYKFQAETKQATVVAVEWSMGRTGKFTPILEITPTELSGALVRHISGYNAKNMLEKGLGVGAIITAKRSNEVIPCVDEVITPAIPTILSHCPYCGSLLKVSPTGIDVFCNYSHCPGLKKKAVYKYLSSICKNIKGLGNSFLEAFVDNLKAATVLELLQNIDNWDRQDFPDLGIANNLIAKAVADEISKTPINPELFLIGLGIPLLGETIAKELSNDPVTLKAIFQAICNYNEDKGLSENLIRSEVYKKHSGQTILSENIASAAQEVREILLYMYSKGRDFDYKSNSSANTRYYALTGSVSKSRNDFSAELELSGWQLTDNISKAQLLINNDNTSNSSKNIKAKAANKPILTEEEFRSTYMI